MASNLSLLAVVLTRENFAHASSWSLAGTAAISVFYPLNAVRTKIQVSPEAKSAGTFVTLMKIVKEEGWRGLFRGWWTAVVALGASNFVYYYCYSMLKIFIQRRLLSRPREIGVVENLAVASIAGVVNVFATTPFWVVNTRVTVRNHKDEKHAAFDGMLSGLQHIARTEGISGLWGGLVPSLILVSNPIVQFVVYEQVRNIVTKIKEKAGKYVSTFEFFLMGALAKAAATVATYPIQLAQSKLRAVATDGDKAEFKGTVDCLNKLAKRYGVLSWFKGMEAKLYQTVLTAAFQFATYEKVVQLVFFLIMRRKAAVPA